MVTTTTNFKVEKNCNVILAEPGINYYYLYTVTDGSIFLSLKATGTVNPDSNVIGIDYLENEDVNSVWNGK